MVRIRTRIMVCIFGGSCDGLQSTQDVQQRRCERFKHSQHALLKSVLVFSIADISFLLLLGLLSCSSVVLVR